MKFLSRNQAETKMIAEMFGRTLTPGSIILAYGELGAGKTCFAQGLAQGLGISRKVNSPTFNIIKEYPGRTFNFYHIDAYRLEDKNVVSDIGFEEILGEQDSVVYIEWPEFIENYLVDYKRVFKVFIAVEPSSGGRLITFKDDIYE